LAEQRGASFVRFPKDKDETDGERALEHALGLGPSALVLAGALGGRTAMALANLQLLRACHARGLDAEMVTERETLRYLGAGQSLDLAPWPRATLNVLPEPEAVVSLRGVAFPLDHERLTAARARGVSNRVQAKDARLTVHEGLALLVLEPGVGP
jgi:thiamine pyrophosphokinase